jgi:hypothetical protein
MAQQTRSAQTARSAQARKTEAAEAAHGPTIRLPGVTAEFHRPHIPGRQELSGAVGTARQYLPPTSHLAFYTGLGLIAAVGVVEWPVAAAIGVGTAVAHRTTS